MQSIRRHYWGTLHFAQTHIASTSSSSSPSSLSQSPSHKDWVSSHFTVQFCLWNLIFVWRVDDDDFLDNLLLIISWKRESFWSMPVKLHQCSKFDIFYNMEILRPGEHPSKPDRFLLNELECWMYAKQCCVLCLFIQLSRNSTICQRCCIFGRRGAESAQLDPNWTEIGADVSIWASSSSSSSPLSSSKSSIIGEFNLSRTFF